MPGNKELGAVLRELRKSRKLTLATVARRAGCAEALVSYVESGNRQLHPWLAAKLDEIYGTGGVVAALLRGTNPETNSRSVFGVSNTDTLIVELPEGGASMPLSRRELLAALGVGITGGLLHGQFERELDKVQLDGDTLQRFDDAYVGFQTAARTLPPSQLMDGLIGNVAVLDGLRRRAPLAERPRYSHMQARYAESLSWLSEEAGDIAGAMYWIDRATQWGQAANWQAMTAYSFVRRSMMVVSFSGDGMRAVDNAQAVFAMPRSSPRMRGLAAKQMAFGHALAGDELASNLALDDAMTLLSKPMREDDAILGQRSVVNDDLFAIFRATCDIYLGRGERVVPVLEPRLSSLSASSVRTATITRAKLARAYANAGQPEEAASLSLAALDDIDRIGSLSARSELKRALPVLSNWHGREDIQMVMQRLKPSV
ncbi:helix-turn-helix domain-containing protein [Actinokineospora soli]|uniref:Helix-turn-helix domain-containing protein n=1 Tax=Actinokineospora soli TaxID=1048753 RepID=A0ABW2TJS8_9PSEU